MKVIGTWNLKIEELNDHPENESIYGVIKPDEETMASIQERGILQDLLVSRRADGTFHLIAGHKRKVNAFAVGLDEVPCKVCEYETIEEENIDFVHSNKARQKTQVQITNEVIYLQKQYKKLAKLRSQANLLSAEKSSNYSEILTTGEVSPTGETAVLIAEQTGLSKDEVKRINSIHNDEYRDGFFKKLVKANVLDGVQNELLKNWDQLREKHNSKELTTNAAFQELMQLQGKVLFKKEKAEKPKVLKPLTKEPQLEVCAEVGGLKCGFIYNDGIRKVAVMGENGVVEVFEWDNVLKHAVIPAM